MNTSLHTYAATYLLYLSLIPNRIVKSKVIMIIRFIIIIDGTQGLSKTTKGLSATTINSYA